MTADAASALPYPGDDPASLASISETLGICSHELTYLNQSLSRTKADLADAWIADAATMCNADIGKLTTLLPSGSKRLADAGTAVETYRTTLLAVRKEIDALRAEWSTASAKLDGDELNYGQANRFGQANEMTPEEISSRKSSLAQDAATQRNALADITQRYQGQVTKANGAAEICSHALKNASQGDTSYQGSTLTTQTLDQSLGLNQFGVLHDVEAHEKAVKLADELKNDPSKAHDVATQAEFYKDDPVFATSFYAELGPDKSQMLPSLIAQTGEPNAYGDVQLFSHLFGTAVTHASIDPGMKPVSDAFLQPAEDASTSWNRGVMAHFGSFPSSWLAQAADVNALNGMSGAQHGQGVPDWYHDMRNRPGAGELSPELANDSGALWLSDLGSNPTAARVAMENMGWDGGHYDVQTNIADIMHYGKDSGGSQLEYAHGYGSAFEAAVGADDEVDGKHSPDAITFSRGLFTTIGAEPDLVVPGAEDPFSKIAASYVQEMAAGQFTAEGISEPNPDHLVAGDNAAFAISPEYAKAFMAGFVDSPDATAVFDTAAGLAAHHAMLSGARMDMADLSGDTPFHFYDASQAYGGVAGAENAAAFEVVNEHVEDEEHAKELMRNVISVGVDMLPMGQLAEEGGAALVNGPLGKYGDYVGNHLINAADSWWDASKHTANMRLESDYSAAPNSEAELKELADNPRQVAIVSDYEHLSILKEAGWPGTDKIPAVLLGPDGQMKSAAAVMSDPAAAKAYYEFMGSHEASTFDGPGGEGNSVFEVTKNSGARFSQAYNQVANPPEE